MTNPNEKRGQSENEDLLTDGETDFAKDPLKDKIGSSLKQIYDDVVNEPIPDDFLSLLAKADNQDASS